MADCRTSYDIQKHEVTICSELDPFNVFGMDLTYAIFFLLKKKKKRGEVKAGELAQWIKLLPQKHKEQNSGPQSPCQSWVKAACL